MQEQAPNYHSPCMGTQKDYFKGHAVWLLGGVLLVASSGCSLFRSIGSTTQTVPTTGAVHTPPSKIQSTSRTVDSSEAENESLEALEEAQEEVDRQLLFSSSERDLLAKIRKELSDNEALSFQAQNLRIVLENGVVRLLGVVESVEEQTEVIRTVKPLLHGHALETDVSIHKGWF